jgi:hypothetical protein
MSIPGNGGGSLLLHAEKDISTEFFPVPGVHASPSGIARRLAASVVYWLLYLVWNPLEAAPEYGFIFRLTGNDTYVH